VARGLEDIAALPDPVGRVLAQWTRPNGLDISRVSVPLGVIGIIYESRPNVTADAGALRGGKSLLPAGVVAVEGAFERGDCVVVRTRAGAEAGRGLSAYASADISRIAGHKSGEIEDILGYRGRDEIIHRDDLVVTEQQ